MTILVVDDEKHITNILNTFLSKKGFKVITANKGEDAISIITSDSSVQFVILDMKMPKKDGIEVLKALKKEKKDLPFLILTGSISKEKHSKLFKDLGYDSVNCLTKPIDLNTILKIIKEKLNIKDK